MRGPAKEMKANYSGLAPEKSRASVNLVPLSLASGAQVSFCILKITLALNWVSGGKNQSQIIADNFASPENIQ